LLSAYDAGGIGGVLGVIWGQVTGFWDSRVVPWVHDVVVTLIRWIWRSVADSIIDSFANTFIKIGEAFDNGPLGKLGEALGAIAPAETTAVVDSVAPVPTSTPQTGPRFRGFANGTHDLDQAQWAWVGERGKELVRLPRGASVYPHGVTPPAYGDDMAKRFAGAPATTNARTTNVYITGRPDHRITADEINLRLRQSEMLNGGVA
jgi:hypothetical protein